MESTFCIHADCNEVQPEELANVRTPAASGCWRPVGHDLVRNAMLSAVASAGFGVKRERWALSQLSKKQRQPGFVAKNPHPNIITQDGNRMFGLIELVDPTADKLADSGGWSYAIGIQNSVDQSMALRNIVAASVFVCDNLVFSTTDENGVVTFRKHTTRIDIDSEARKAIAAIRRGFEPLAGFIGSLQSARCTDDQFNEVVCQSIRRGIVTSKQPNDLLTAWYDRKSERPDFDKRLKDGFYDDRNGWTAHGLFTDAIGKGINQTAAGNRSIEAQKGFNEVLSSVLELN